MNGFHINEWPGKGAWSSGVREALRSWYTVLDPMGGGWKAPHETSRPDTSSRSFRCFKEFCIPFITFKNHTDTHEAQMTVACNVSIEVFNHTPCPIKAPSKLYLFSQKETRCKEKPADCYSKASPPPLSKRHKKGAGVQFCLVSSLGELFSLIFVWPFQIKKASRTRQLRSPHSPFALPY